MGSSWLAQWWVCTAVLRLCLWSCLEECMDAWYDVASVDFNSFVCQCCHLHGAPYKPGTNFWMSFPLTWDVAKVDATVCISFQIGIICPCLCCNILFPTLSNHPVVEVLKTGVVAPLKLLSRRACRHCFFFVKSRTVLVHFGFHGLSKTHGFCILVMRFLYTEDPQTFSTPLKVHVLHKAFMYYRLREKPDIFSSLKLNTYMSFIIMEDKQLVKTYHNKLCCRTTIYGFGEKICSIYAASLLRWSFPLEYWIYFFLENMSENIFSIV